MLNIILCLISFKRKEKDRSWMYGSRESSKFVDGVFEFCHTAVNHQATTKGIGFYCPSVKCANVRKVDTIDELREHIIRRGSRVFLA